MNRPTCEECVSRAGVNRKKGLDDPDPVESGRCYGSCWGVPKVDLAEGNRDIWGLYKLVENQVLVAGFGGIIGVRHDAFFNVMDLYAVTDTLRRRVLFERFILLDAEITRIRNENEKVLSKRAQLEADANARRRS